MTDPFAVTEPAFPVPEAAVQVDLEAEFTKLLLRCSKLENRLEAAQRDAVQAQYKLLVGLLDVADALERILQPSSSSDDTVQVLERQRGNVESTYRLLQQKLTGIGVQPVQLLGMVADPEIADIVGYQENPDLPDETVIREIVKAYLWQHQLLRRGQVLVSRRL